MHHEATYDFYFSFTRKMQLLAAAVLKGKTYAPAYYSGREYTERVVAGETPTHRYADLVKVGTGSNKLITYKS